MQFSESLKNNQQFRFVYKNGRSYANKYFIMYVKENGLDKNRIGIKYVSFTEEDVMGSKRETVGLYNPTAAQSR